MLNRNKFWKRIRWGAAIFLLVLITGILYFAYVALDYPPKPDDKSSLQLTRKEVSPGFYVIGNNWFRRNKNGLYEMYVEGKPFERGVIAGKLSAELVIRQEDHFNEQINKLIPSRFYRYFLKYFIAWFNRHLDENVTEEYKEEIYGISQSASADYQYIGSNYQRILNYHAAHDIGHALQSMAMVGCTSFATWNARSADSSLIIGRNFDFYVGDKFAEDKIVEFVNPSAGNKFMIVTWGGFIGVVSGMNDKGLTVTINAARSSIPSGAATPVSLVAREILQYASNFKEAYSIAQKRKMFVSESFLIGSAEDAKAILIEKTPDSLEIYDPKREDIICANHFQSEHLGHSKSNREQIRESASDYRFRRMEELLSGDKKNTVQQTVEILRDRSGLHDADIGMGNEKAINQLIAHHSVVFEPQKLLAWVSTSPWQLGPFVAYDLRKIFGMKGMWEDHEICEDSLFIAADPFLLTADYQNFVRFRKYRQALAEGKAINPEDLITNNTEYYLAYCLAGDYVFQKKEYQRALQFYTEALGKEIATQKEKDHIDAQILLCREKIKSGL